MLKRSKGMVYANVESPVKLEGKLICDKNLTNLKKVFLTQINVIKWIFQNLMNCLMIYIGIYL